MAGRNDRLQVDEDSGFQRRDWVFERVGWAGLLVVLLSAAAGVFGRGPLSERTVSTSDGAVRVEYGRFERHGAPTELRLTLARAAGDTALRMWIDQAFIDAVNLDRITPEPAAQSSDGRRSWLEFELPPGSDTTRVLVRFTPDRIGPRVFQLGVGGAAAVRLHQFVYP